MRRPFLLAAYLLASCAGDGAGGTAVPVVTGDACALYQDATSCRADPAGCAWYPNTRACAVGQPCPAGWCYTPQPADGGAGIDGGVGGVSAACACPGTAGDVCVEQIGGPAIQEPPPIVCEAIPADCALADRCGCLAQGPIERCASSDQVANLCICDDGIR